MAFLLVEFEGDEAGRLAVVHNNWMTPLKTQVFWPPYKQKTQYNRALLKGEEAKVDTWKLFAIKRCFYTSDDLDKINEKLKLCEHTSDLQTDLDEPSQKKRQRIRNRKYFSSDSEEDDDAWRLPRPPRIDKIKRRIVEEGRLTFDIDCTASDTNTPAYTSINAEEQNRHFHETTSCTPKDRGSWISPVNEIDNNLATPASSSLYNNPEESVFNKRILTLLETIKEQNKRILSIIEHKQQPIINDATLPVLPVELPVTNLAALQVLDAHLKGNADQSTALCSYLSTIGGTDITNKITRILKYLLVDEVAKNYNFYGKRSHKKAFCDLALKNIIIRAVKSSEPKADDSVVEGTIKVWLKHAPGRLKIVKDPAAT